METMGDRIKQLLQAQGMSQAELARRVGVTRAAVQKWISGDTANMENAALLLTARELHTDAAYLVWGADRKPAGAPAVPSAPEDTGASGRFRVGGRKRS
jgi:transcriptional regulator with XRE-family HTH domain